MNKGEILWTPRPEARDSTQLGRYLRWLTAARQLSFANYEDLWLWSVTELEAFWSSVWDYFDVQSRGYERVLDSRRMPGARWFSGAELNYAEHALRRRDQHPAIVSRNESGARAEITRARLAELVGRARAGLRRLGVTRGDRVVGFVSNIPEALVAFLATASLGAVWSSCPPEFGARSVLDRFKQIEPKVLVCVDGYRYGGRTFDRTGTVEEIRRELPTLEHTVVISKLGQRAVTGGGATSFDDLLREHEPLSFERVAFDHPLWIVYSSGTTGLPKAIVNGHGGILLEYLKALGLHCDLGVDDRASWFTTTGWIVWNYLAGGLLLGATIVLYDGSPRYPDMLALWRMAEQEKVTFFGTSPAFLSACRTAGIRPTDAGGFGRLRTVGVTGAPLAADEFAWVYQAVKRDLLVGSMSGGTETGGAFVGPCPLLPVRAGEMQCRMLGAKVEAFDEAGRSMIDKVGELVLTAPMPSMPTRLWNDPERRRYRDSYFSQYQGVWRHGDWVEITSRGGVIIYGRSDATLNRDGVRVGTSEFYRLLESFPEVADSVVVDTCSLDHAQGKLWLFIVPRPGHAVDDALRGKVRDAIRRELSPRHVPDEIREIAEVPRTLSGKKLEVPIKRILQGTPVEAAVSRGTLENPESIEVFTRFVEPSA